VAVHSFLDDVSFDAVLAGVDSVEHGTDLTDRTIAAMAERGVCLCPTLLALEYWRRKPEAMPEYIRRPDVMARVEVIQEQLALTVERAYRAGVRVVSGSDQRGVRFPIGGNAGEIVLLNEAGLSQVDALRAATSHAADLLGLGDRVGRLRPGFDADILVIAGNPLVDLHLLHDASAIRYVFKHGKPVSHPQSHTSRLSI
jgi:imidazolonepropionase-like amidohydrolase